jgi:hypothetical protein
VEEYLGEVFIVEEPPNAEQGEHVNMASGRRESPVAEIYELPSVGDNALAEENAAKDDWISRDGRQRREVKGVWYRRKADFLASSTEPDSSPMKRRDSKGSHLGYYLKEALKKPPPDGGMWNSPKVGEWIERRTGKILTQKKQRGWKYMRELGQSPKVPRPPHNKANKAQQEAFKKSSP